MIKRPFENLYIHIPFCSNKCGYCAFYSEPSSSSEQIDNYLDSLTNKIAGSPGQCGPLNTVYVGGGTPSLLSTKQLERLLTAIADLPGYGDPAEVSVEVNPESMDQDKAGLLAAYTSRVTLGIQSTVPELRSVLQRQGSVADVYRAVETLRDAGVENLGVDLIYAIPGQSRQDWHDELGRILELEPQHISAYALTEEEGTKLAGKVDIDDDLGADLWWMSVDVLGDAGYPVYEVSNYAASENECVHNQNIWHGQTYLGLGPSATSFDGCDRWTQPASNEGWMAGEEPDRDIIDPAARAREILIMGLRTVKGWDIGSFQQLTGIALDLSNPEFSSLADAGLVEITQSNIHPTTKGLLFWDTIAETLLV